MSCPAYKQMAFEQSFFDLIDQGDRDGVNQWESIICYGACSLINSDKEVGDPSFIKVCEALGCVDKVDIDNCG